MKRLAGDWIAAFGRVDADYEPADEENPFTLIDSIVQGDRLYAWHLLMEIVERDQNTRSLPLLFSSHVERFLELHGEAMVDYIEEDIRQSPVFREMLWYVRQGQTLDRVWARIDALKSAQPPAG